MEGSTEFTRLRPRLALTTNGSLLSPAILDFLDRHGFFVELSFDALAQNTLRKRGSFPALCSALDGLLARPGIKFEVNSVFTPRSVSLLSGSVKFLVESGVRDTRISTALNSRWTRASLDELGRQLRRVGRRMAVDIRSRGEVPVSNFRSGPPRGKRVFACGAGKGRMAVSPEGDIWGCHLFPDLYRVRGRPAGIRAFRFGRAGEPEAFERDYISVLGRHADLSQDSFSVSGHWCLFCPELASCEVCPLHSAFAGARMGEIPPHICAIQRLWIAEKKALARALEVANHLKNG